MGFFNSLSLRFHQVIAKIFIERPARRMGIDNLITRLEKSGQKLEKRLAGVSGRQKNQEIIVHVIGIERWGLRRMHAALGEPVTDEEYHAYCPAERKWPQLLDSLRATRQATVAMGKTIRMARVDANTRIYHNQFGEISLLGWLYYLDIHARLESMRIN